MTARARRELLVARRSIAIGKLLAFHDQSHRLAELVTAGVVPRADALAAMIDADIANGLTATFGPDIVAPILSKAFGADA